MPVFKEHTEIVLRGINKKRYSNLGYKIPDKLEINTKIKVKISDLPKCSGTKILVQCPICDKIRSVAYYNYLRSSDVCHSCSAKKQGKNNTGKNNGMFGRRGKETPQYKHGNTKLPDVIRKSIQYQEWRKRVWDRDRYTCYKCLQFGGNLNCHHIIPLMQLIKQNNIKDSNWRSNYNILFNTDNGITLCKKCHIRLHEIYGGNKVIIGESELFDFLNIE